VKEPSIQYASRIAFWKVLRLRLFVLLARVVLKMYTIMRYWWNDTDVLSKIGLKD